MRSSYGSEEFNQSINSIDYGPIDHPRAQGTVKRLGGWLQGVLAELCMKWPKRWDDYVQPALWLHRTSPDPRLPGSPTPFRLLFRRDVRTQIEAVSPDLDNSELMGTGLQSLIDNKEEDWRHVLKSETYQKALQATRDQERTRVNNSIAHHSAGVKAKRGYLVLVHESDSTLGNEGVHRKLVHEKWTGPWTVTAVITPGLCYQVVLNGRQIRERRAAASHPKP